MKTLRVAVVSSRSRFCDLDANLAHFSTLTARAAGRGARLVCFPELALTSYSTRPEALDAAQPVPGPATESLCEIAAENDVYLSVGLAEKSRGKYHITQAVVGPRGYLGKYRKYHPTGGEIECGFSPGRRFPTFDIDSFVLGINICFDGRHGDTIAAMRKAKVDLIHHPHGNGLSLGRDAEEWTRGKLVYFVPRAITARAYILINNSAGDTAGPGGTTSYGSGAMVIDPLGQVVARTTQTTRSEKLIVTDIIKPLSELIPPHEMTAISRMGDPPVVS